MRIFNTAEIMLLGECLTIKLVGNPARLFQLSRLKYSFKGTSEKKDCVQKFNLNKIVEVSCCKCSLFIVFAW